MVGIELLEAVGTKCLVVEVDELSAVAATGQQGWQQDGNYDFCFHIFAKIGQYRHKNK
jgi:hypothetical protein